MLKITKLDRRFTGFNLFKYIAEVDILSVYGKDERIKQFKVLRAWMWETFGPGCELDYVVLRPEAVGTEGQCRMATIEQWAWQTNFGEMRLYLKDDGVLSLLKLKWS